MYLARIRQKGKRRYVIRESYEDGGVYRSRDLMELGADPSRHILYPGGNAYYVDPDIEERLRRDALAFSDEDLDAMFFPWVDPEIRRKLEGFVNRSRSRRPPPTDEGPQLPAPHIFDLRRIHYLRCGTMGQGNVGSLPRKMTRMLRGRSRDEVEQSFLRMEDRLRYREHKAYVFVIFDLHRFFRETFARQYPEMLPEEAVDACFLEALCRLNADETFWSGMETPDERLHPYLVRYPILYFDADWGRTRYLEDLARQFVDSHRRYRPPEGVRVRAEEAARLFEVSGHRLRRMNRGELTRLYRKRAQKLHPDKGGTHEGFVTLTRAYRALLRRKPA
jgi:hypothetical protein